MNTRSIFVSSHFFVSLLEGMFNLLIFIFCKDLNATPLQLTLLVSAKPVMALFAFYGNLILKGRPDRIKHFLIGASLLGGLPALFFPLMDSVWYFLAANALFMLSVKAAMPAWAELLRINLLSEKRGGVFAQGATVNYLLTVFIPLLVSPLLDLHPHIWKSIFAGLSVVQIANIVILACIKIDATGSCVYQTHKITSMNSLFIEPLKQAIQLLRRDRDFRNYQILVVLAGAGMVALYPVLPVFYVETLHLSYTELALATALCKGFAFMASSPIWAYWINRISLFLFNFYVGIFACLFVMFVMAANINVYWIYLAYIMFGALQAGHELSWNLSGPIFAKDRDSSLYSSINLAVIGLRGCFFPILGQLLFVNTNISFVLISAESLCLLGLFYSFFLFKQKKFQFNKVEG